MPRHYFSKPLSKLQISFKHKESKENKTKCEAYNKESKLLNIISSSFKTELRCGLPFGIFPFVILRGMKMTENYCNYSVRTSESFRSSSANFGGVNSEIKSKH